jgi:hypothetical protein
MRVTHPPSQSWGVSRVRLPRWMSFRYRGVRNRSWTRATDCQRLGGTANDESKEMAEMSGYDGTDTFDYVIVIVGAGSAGRGFARHSEVKS